MNIREEVIEAFAAQLALVTKATAVFEGRTPDIGLIRLAALHCRILAHAHAILALVQNGCIPAIPTQLRSQLDGYIDFQLSL